MTVGSRDADWLRKILRHDAIAWMQLFSHYAPIVEKIVRSNRAMGSYRDSEDDVRNVMASVFERLRRDDFRALRTFQLWHDKHPEKSFPDWLTILTVNVVRNYITAKLGAPSPDGKSVKQLVNTYAETSPSDDGLVYLPHATTKETARRILEYAQAHLPADQLSALAGWLEGRSFEELATEHGLEDARAADRLVRAALARLRRQFET